MIMNKTIWQRISLISLAVLMMTLVFAGAVHAAQPATDGNIQGPIDHDVFVIDQDVTIKGEIKGTVVVFGSTITLDGRIEGDAFLAGSRVTILNGSEITGNLYVAGSEIQLEGAVDGSVAAAGLSAILQEGAEINRAVYFAGYNLHLESGSQIGKNLHAAVYQALLNGIIQEDARISASAIEIRGAINGDAVFDVAAPGAPNFYLSFIPGVPVPASSGLRVYEGAVINGNLKYTSTVNQNSTIHIQSTPIFITPVPGEPAKQAAEPKPTQTTTTTFVMTWLWSFLSRLITYLVLGAIALQLVPAVVEITRKQIHAKFFETAGIGFVTIITGLILVILVPVVFIALGIAVQFLSLGGLNLAWFGLLGGLLLAAIAIFFFVLFNGSILVSCYALGDLMLVKVDRERPSRNFLAMLAGVGVFVLLRSAPYFGWILGPLAAIVGMGALWLAFLRSLKKKKPVKRVKAKSPA